jgi:outer membrane protein assembly factor BamB
MKLGAKNKKTLLLVTVLILSLFLLVSCIGGGTVARGWAGVSEIDDTLVFASMTGKIYSVNSADGTVRGDPIKMVMAASGGLSCIPSCGGQQTSAIAIYASPGVAGDLVYIGGYNDGKVYAYQLVDGKLKEEPLWTYPRQGDLGASIIGGLTVANGKLYFSTASGTVYALTAAEGYKEWSYNIGKKIWSAPAVEGDTLYISSFDKKVYALDIATGAKKWEYETGGALSATPLVKDGLVYIGSYDRHFYALDTSGKLVWKFPVDDDMTDAPSNWFWVGPIVHNDVIYAPCLDGKVYVLNALTGSYIDTIDLRPDTANIDVAISSSPVLINDMMVVAATRLYKNSGSYIYKIDITNGTRTELTRFNEGVNAPLFANGEFVYLHTTRDNFYKVNLLSGEKTQITLTASK